MTVVACLPDQSSIDLLGDVSGEVELITWNGHDAPPAQLGRTEFWVPQVDDEVDLPAAFAAMPELKVMQLTSAGIEHVVGQVPDSVTLCDGRGIHGGAVAEWVLTVVLAAQRELVHFLDAQRSGRWEPVRSRELQDARVLVVGAGDLGEQTERRLQACGAETIMVARTAREGAHGTDELPELLPDADIVVILVPQTPQTVGLVDADFLARMPDGALLVNAARGPVVDTDALLAELTSTRLRAALDVTDPEPLPAGHPLWSAPNLILTPHTAGHVGSAAPRAYRLVADQLRRYCAGEELINVVDGAY